MQPASSSHQHPVWAVRISTSAPSLWMGTSHEKPLSKIKGDIHRKERNGNRSSGSGKGGNCSRFSETNVKGHTAHLGLRAVVRWRSSTRKDLQSGSLLQPATSSRCQAHVSENSTCNGDIILTSLPTPASISVLTVTCSSVAGPC